MKFQCNGKMFDNATAAIEFARKQVGMMSFKNPVMSIWLYDLDLIVAVVTDDANGITVHKLKTWPEGVEV